MSALSFGRIWKNLRLHRPSSHHGNLSRMLSFSSISRELNDEHLLWLTSPDFRVCQGSLKSCSLVLLQKLLLGIWSCTGSDRSFLLLHYHSRNTSRLGLAPGSTRETPAAALRDSVRWNPLYAVQRTHVQSLCASKSLQSREWLRGE